MKRWTKILPLIFIQWYARRNIQTARYFHDRRLGVMPYKDTLILIDECRPIYIPMKCDCLLECEGHDLTEVNPRCTDKHKGKQVRYTDDEYAREVEDADTD